ncbi:hypothetical protein [Arthrobacter sp. zg-Y1110]|uniref:hypothetical protein n=1 Tax=Arthrobacter sp. zg-Y1110 TaxID=2886932 RepID=UPI001D13F4FE|nr:hypothetical protein [Arthrobacter sp. zg-Y1110]MCC3292994.1 hypothetical protein [Arthrobacter sp. zg-Y1110]UWX86933.1 hypothetical protein N2K99_18995 [Arthrobacter sp. zg-Y1110]
MFRPRVQAGVTAGGQFASRGRQESPVSLSDRRSENALFHNMTRGTMELSQQRPLARSAVRKAIGDGSAARMLGRNGAGDIAVIEAAVRQDRKLDAAVDALVEQERKHPGRIPSNALGYHLCRQLLQAERNPQRLAS